MVTGAVDPSGIVDFVEEALRATDDIPEPIILIAGSLQANWSLAESNRFEYTRHDPSKPIFGEPSLTPSGFFDGVPVYAFHTENERLLLVADLRQLGTWHQYHPSPQSELSEYIDEVILIELESYTETSARQLLRDQPEVFRFDPAENRERDDEERRSLVLTHVRVLFLEQFKYNVALPTAGRVVRFSE